MAATYRGHGHALALGVDPQALLDEMLGRATGVNGGRAGSMNVTSPADRLIGSFGIVGGSIAAATGAALALSRTTGGVAVAYFGDGAMNQGYVFECLNFAQVQKLPLVLVCENNGYGEYTPFRSVTAGEIRSRAEVMEVPAETVDGMSVWTVREAAARAIDHARAGNGPAFLEALTYRFVGHSRSDPGAYRPEGELDEWRTRDPIVVLRAQLEDDGAGASALDELEREVRERARADARAWPRRAVPVRARRRRVQGLSVRVRRADDAEAVRLRGRRRDRPLAEGARRGLPARRGACWRSRRTRRPSSTRPRTTGRSRRSWSPRASRRPSDSPSPGLQAPGSLLRGAHRRRASTNGSPQARRAPERDTGRATDRGRARPLAARRRRDRPRRTGSRARTFSVRWRLRRSGRREMPAGTSPSSS